MLVRRPIGDMLCAVYGDSSTWDNDSVHFEVFVLPLFVPHEHVSFNYGFRLKMSNRPTWRIEDGAEAAFISELTSEVNGRAVAFFEDFGTVQKFVENAPRKYGDNADAHYLETLASAYLMLDLVSESKETIAILKDYLAMAIRKEPSCLWMYNMSVRIDQLKKLIDNSPESGRDTLRKYRIANLQTLKLETMDKTPIIIRSPSKPS